MKFDTDMNVMYIGIIYIHVNGNVIIHVKRIVLVQFYYIIT